MTVPVSSAVMVSMARSAIAVMVMDGSQAPVATGMSALHLMGRRDHVIMHLIVQPGEPLRSKRPDATEPLHNLRRTGGTRSSTSVDMRSAGRDRYRTSD
jgi:hypothetical protein